jgi:hypothetical protein
MDDGRSLSEAARQNKLNEEIERGPGRFGPSRKKEAAARRVYSSSYGFCILRRPGPLGLRSGLPTVFVTAHRPGASLGRAVEDESALCLGPKPLDSVNRHTAPEACPETNRRAGTAPGLSAIQSSNSSILLLTEFLSRQALHNPHRGLAPRTPVERDRGSVDGCR